MLNLDWLPLRPDLAEVITAARSAETPSARLDAAIELAAWRGDGLATLRIDKLAQSALEEALPPSGFQRRSLGILSSSTVEHLTPAIRVAGLRHRLILDLLVTPYGQLHQTLLNAASPFDGTSPDFLLFAPDEASALPPLPLTATAQQAADAIEHEMESLRTLWRLGRARFGAAILQQTILNTRLPLFGSYEFMVPGAPAALIDRLNDRIRAEAADEGVMLLDVERQAAWLGRSAWSDPVRWHQAKQVVAPAAAPFYGDLVARVIAAAGGLSRKCLILDLDNTIWGGVVGDDGIDGIVLGPGSVAGEAYLAFQRFAVALARRGIVLAICSKNECDLVESVFANHPEMLLKREDVAFMAVNWDDKATNLRLVARQLELGLDAMVFIDDNPAERAIVRRELPMVAVPELPEDVAQYGAAISQAGYFEAVAFTSEDSMRAAQYADNSRRSEALAAATDMESFLRSLDMVMEARRPSSTDVSRVTQLINKTNQFNLTTRRYTVPEVEHLLEQNDTIVLRFRLTDCFGDNGIIAVIIAFPQNGDRRNYLIDTWLMSCRVLGRGVEAACLCALAAQAAKAGAEALIGKYHPTPRNQIVHNHYRRLGFLPEESLERDGASFWRLDLVNYEEPKHYINIAQ